MTSLAFLNRPEETCSTTNWSKCSVKLTFRVGIIRIPHCNSFYYDTTDRSHGVWYIHVTPEIPWSYARFGG